MISYISNFIDFCINIFATIMGIVSYMFGDIYGQLLISCLLFIVVLAIIRGVRG